MRKVSIIVPVYNSEKTLERCLESIINQTYKNIEIICINDGSVDCSLKMLKKYAKKDSRIIIVDKINEGVSKARNIGLKKATGSYVTFVDADDYVEVTAIESMVDVFEDNNVDLVRCNYRVNYNNSEKVDVGNFEGIDINLLTRNDIKNMFLPKILDGSIPCFVYLIMIKKEILDKKIYFKEDIHMMEDVIFYIELINNIDSLYILDEVLYNIVFNTEGATNNSKNYERNILNVILVNSYIKKNLKKYKLNSKHNVESLNLANLNAISDFIFKHYLAGLDSIDLSKSLSKNGDLLKIIHEVDFTKMNLQRRIIVKCISDKHFYLLSFYFKVRKIIFKFKHKFI